MVTFTEEILNINVIFCALQNIQEQLKDFKEFKNLWSPLLKKQG